MDDIFDGILKNTGEIRVENFKLSLETFEGGERYKKVRLIKK